MCPRQCRTHPQRLLRKSLTRISRDDERDCCGNECKIDQISGHAIRQLLHRCARTLGMLNGLDNSAVARIAPDPLDADFERPRLVDGARVHQRVRQLLNRHRLTRNPGLVNERVATGHDAIYWYQTAGVNEYGIADA